MNLTNHLVAWLALLLCILKIPSSRLGQQTGYHWLSVRVVILCPSKYIRGGASYRPVFLNCRAAVRYRALASITQGREGPEETTIGYKILLVQLITN
jgi:hypothetical protein